MVGASILVVEDERIIAAHLQHLLLRMGHNVVAIVTSGREALDKAAALRPEVVLMDVKLRGEMGGLEAGESIRAQWHIPVIYMTAYTGAAALADAGVAPPILYISKPFDAEHIHTVLRMALEPPSSEPR